VVTNDDIVVLASEAGVVDVAENVRQKGRLQPGKMFLVDTIAGRIISDEEIKRQLTSRQPYAQWIKENQITLEQMASRALCTRSGAGILCNRGSGPSAIPKKT
jgi:glutamate synthase (NADPH/NADH) large chain